jgi:hypothetical protein
MSAIGGSAHQIRMPKPSPLGPIQRVIEKSQPTNGPFVVFQASRSAPADFGDEVDFAVGVERGEVGVLVDLAVDCQSHAFVDLMPQAGEAAVELEDQRADIVRLDLELRHPRAYCGQIFQITPVLGICTSAASAGFLKAVSGLERPKSRIAP